ncbi:endonuclease/exonuclease/phosphatase family protein [Glycomyces xiaoerkulensis]|uniref:endonuclease/exonuclease/phosphatase family protein n=1 Tax=Glycomyces xiaoerkulensis TaxID=2038139 RepID=UPI000C25F07A|nr:endonuclease/exonuclease/phosphatase family protein [Glycomyces xiaoerkulensis]
MTGLLEDRPAATESRRRWCWGTRIVVAAASAWTVFLIAHLLLTGEVWWWSAIEMTPPPALALPPAVLAVGALWAARGVRWRVEVVAATTALIVAPMTGFNPAALLEDGEPDGEADLRVFSWNTDYWHVRFDDPEAFYDHLLEQDADVYLLTEYLTRTNMVVPIDDEAALREHFEGWHISIASEMVTISRHPIVEQRAIDTTGVIGPDDPGAPGEGDWEEYWTTKVLRTDVEVDGRIASLYNLHLAVPVPTEGSSPFGGEFWGHVRAQYQRRSAQVDLLLEDLAGNPHPVLVAGDLNSSALSGAVTALKNRLDCPDPDGEFLPTSWPQRRFGFPQLWRLDWACTGTGASIAGYGFGTAAGMSDHKSQHIDLVLGEA